MKIRPRKNPSGKIVWQLDLGEGKGRRKTFKSKTKAQTALDQEKDRRARHGSMADDITPADMAEIVTARNRLQEAGASISQAAEFYLSHAVRISEPLLLPELAERFRASRRKKGLSDGYVQNLKSSIGRLAKQFPLMLAHELTSKQIQEWVSSGGWNAKTQNNLFTDISAMFSWAIQQTQGHARINPCLSIERPAHRRRGKVSSLEVDQVEQLLITAASQCKWRVLTFLVVGAFGGLRPEAEATDPKFKWEDVDLDERHMRLSEEVVKTGPGRVVDLTPQAAAWLRLIPADLRKEGPVVPLKNWKDEWMRFRHSLGWLVANDNELVRRNMTRVEIVHGPWPGDVLRHTFASYHYAHHQNEALLQVQMGHTSAKMLHEHYRAVRTRKEGAAFWAITPKE